MTQPAKPKERPFIHRWRSAVFNSDLSSTGRIVILALAEYANGDGSECTPALDSIAKLAGVNEKTARKALAEASEKGFIERWAMKKGYDWRRWQYALHLPNGADSTPARSLKAAEEKSAPIVSKAADSTPARSPERCGQSVQKVRTFTPNAAGATPNELVKLLAGKALTGEARALALSTDNAVPEDRFDEFWSSYPRKIGDKKAARRHWVKQRLDRLADVILLAVNERAANDPRWADLQFVPYPTTYLRGERWNDEWRTTGTGCVRQTNSHSIAASFQGRTYAGTPDDELPEHLR
jgi:pyocin large subunit-like protein